MEQAVLVLGPPVAIDILLADLALGPAAVGGADLVSVHGDVLHSNFSFMLVNFINSLRIEWTLLSSC